MTQKLSLSTIALLTVPPLLWASNVIIGRLISNMLPPITLNFFRWLIAFFILLPFAYSIFRRGSGLWQHRTRYACLGLLGIGLYNALQYLALQSSTPINVTLVASSIPVWMLLIGAMFFGVKVNARQIVGAGLSIAGVLLVLSHGDIQQLLAFRLLAGDMLMILAAIVWCFYSWLLTKTKDPVAIRQDWAAFLLAQVTYGLLWSGMFAAGEWAVVDAKILWSWPLVAAIIFVAVGPAIIAFRCWGAGVQRAGANVAGFFSNLTPLFAAVMSSAVLHELPHLYHIAAFALIVGGIVVSSRK